MDKAFFMRWRDIFCSKGFKEPFYSASMPDRSSDVLHCWVFFKNDFVIYFPELSGSFIRGLPFLYIHYKNKLAAKPYSHEIKLEEMHTFLEALSDPMLLPLCIHIPWAKKLVSELIKGS